jgi:hypothetical protein
MCGQGAENLKTGFGKRRKGDRETDRELYDVRDCVFKETWSNRDNYGAVA